MTKWKQRLIDVGRASMICSLLSMSACQAKQQPSDNSCDLARDGWSEFIVTVEDQPFYLIEPLRLYLSPENGKIRFSWHTRDGVDSEILFVGTVRKRLNQVSQFIPAPQVILSIDEESDCRSARSLQLFADQQLNCAHRNLCHFEIVSFQSHDAK